MVLCVTCSTTELNNAVRKNLRSCTGLSSTIFHGKLINTKQILYDSKKYCKKELKF